MHAAAEPVPPPPPGVDAAPSLRVHAWSPGLRLIALALQVIGAGNLLYLAYLCLFEPPLGLEPLVPLGPILRLALLVAALLLLPQALLWVLRRITSGTLLVESGRLVLQLRGVRFEIPTESVTGLEPWKLPLPGAGLALRMKSGRRFEYHLQAAAPETLLTALARALPGTDAAAQHPSARFEQARHDGRRRFWDKPAFKFGVFPLLPTGVMFRAHQLITFGGALGEYNVSGLGAYLKTFAGFWHTFALGLLLLASLWRLAAELLAFALTWALPSRARGIRTAAEWLCRLVYYVAAPTLMAIPFLL
jgi:hypothetical protein